jgi:hypothetical protein
MWLEGTYLYDRTQDASDGSDNDNHTLIFHLRWEL